MASQTENRDFHLELLDLQKQLGEEKKAHGETILRFLTAQAQAETAEADATKARELVAETTLKLDQARGEIWSLKAQAQEGRSQTRELLAAQAKVNDLEAQMAQMKVTEQVQAQSAIEAQNKLESLREAQTQELQAVQAKVKELEAQMAQVSTEAVVKAQDLQKAQEEIRNLKEEQTKTQEAQSQELRAAQAKIKGLETTVAKVRMTLDESVVGKTECEAQAQAQELAQVEAEPEPNTQKAEKDGGLQTEKTSGFGLLRLPLVALRHAFRIMKPSDLFILSLKYPQIRIAAKSINPKIKIFHADSRCTGLISIRLENEKGVIEPLLSVTNCIISDLSGSTIWKIRGQEVEIRHYHLPNDRPPQLQSYHTHNQILWTGIEQTLNDLYGPRPFSVYVSPLDLHSFPKIKNEIRELTIGSVRGLDVAFSSERFDQFIGSHNVTEYLRIGCEFDNQLRTDCALLNVKELSLWKASNFLVAHLFNFKGRHLALYDPKIKTLEIIAFLGSWMEGHFDDLETVGIFLTNKSKSSFDFHMVHSVTFGSIKFTKSEVRKYVTTAQDNYDKDGSKGYYDCTNAWNLKRPSDGRVASVKCTKDKFFFFVWKN